MKAMIFNILIALYLAIAVLFSVFVVVMLRADEWEMTAENLFPYLLAVWLWPLTVASAFVIHWNDKRKNKKLNAEAKRRSQVSATVIDT